MNIQSMVNRTIRMMLVAVVLSPAIGQEIETSGTADVQVETQSKEASQPTADVSGEKQRPKEARPVRYALLVQYAKANLDLAEVELQQMLQINRKSPGVIPSLTIARLESNVAVARKQFDEATLASANSAEQIRLRHAQERLRVALIELTEVQRTAEQGVIDDLELQRVSLRYELARLNLELVKNPEDFLTLLPYLEAKVNRLSEEILELDKRLSKLEPTGFRYRQ